MYGNVKWFLLSRLQHGPTLASVVEVTEGKVNASWSGAEEEMLVFKVSVSPGLFLGFVF